jgi:hypothetical protein
LPKKPNCKSPDPIFIAIAFKKRKNWHKSQEWQKLLSADGKAGPFKKLLEYIGRRLYTQKVKVLNIALLTPPPQQPLFFASFAAADARHFAAAIDKGDQIPKQEALKRLKH